MKRIGIFSGTFDPIHAGHLAFALEAADSAKLDEVYFLPENQPRRKEGVTHYAHRVAMLRLALKPHKQFKLLELQDRRFSVDRTLPKLRGRFKEAELFMLVGSDMVDVFLSAEWPGSKRLLKDMTLIVGVRGESHAAALKKILSEIQDNAQLLHTKYQHVSSRNIRAELTKGKLPSDLLHSIRKYVKDNWLYVSVR